MQQRLRTVGIATTSGLKRNFPRTCVPYDVVLNINVCVARHCLVFDFIARPYQLHSDQHTSHPPQRVRATSPAKHPTKHALHKTGHRIDRRRDPRIEQPE